MTCPDAERDARRDEVKRLARGAHLVWFKGGDARWDEVGEYIVMKIDEAVADARAENERLAAVIEVAQRLCRQECDGSGWSEGTQEDERGQPHQVQYQCSGCVACLAVLTPLAEALAALAAPPAAPENP